PWCPRPSRRRAGPDGSRSCEWSPVFSSSGGHAITPARGGLAPEYRRRIDRASPPARMQRERHLGPVPRLPRQRGAGGTGLAALCDLLRSGAGIAARRARRRLARPRLRDRCRPAAADGPRGAAGRPAPNTPGARGHRLHATLEAPVHLKPRRRRVRLEGAAAAFAAPRAAGPGRPGMRSPRGGPGVSAERLAASTQSARGYGFHATLTAPSHLKPGRRRDELEAAAAAFAATRAPVPVRLGMRSLGGFLALMMTPPDHRVLA